MKERMQRFDEYMKRKGINDNQVTVNCGLAQGLLGKCRTGASDLGARTIDKILNFYQDLSRQWLIAGAGEMLVQDNIQQGSGSTWTYLIIRYKNSRPHIPCRRPRLKQ